MSKLIFVLMMLLVITVLPVTAQEMSYQEAPMLTEKVTAGELSPLAERLPQNPLVIEPLQEIGTYGGTLRIGTAAVTPYLTENLTRETLTTFPMPVPGTGAPTPNLAESWEYNDAGTQVTVHLRQGIKWSDGEPFTAEDIAFYWYDIMLDENVVIPIDGILLVDGEPPVLEVVDDYTLTFTYNTPYYYFAEAMATIWEIAWPKHYMSQYHPKYNANATYEELNNLAEWHTGRGAVTLQAWYMAEYVPGEFMRLARNPYYWKVDTEGNQLPYMDEVVVDVVEDRQAVAVGNVTGQFDFDTMWTGVQHLPLFLESMEDRDYSLGSAYIPGMLMYINLDHPDPVKNAAFRNLDFRRALSVGINRQEIGDVLYSGLLTPSGTVFSPTSPFYEEDAAHLWATYDPDEARAMLDAAGYVDTNGDGFREAPGGESLDIVINVAQHDLYTPSVEMVIEDWADIGIKGILNVRDQDLINSLYLSGDFEVSVWDYYGGDVPLAGDLSRLASTGPNTPAWHMDWQENPISDDFLEVNRILNNATTMPAEERNAALTEVSRMMANNVWNIHLGFYRRPFIKSNRLGNMPDEIARDSQVTAFPPFQLYQVFERYPAGEAPAN